ncbi:MAG: FAD-dependent oxidoreductase, partial [Bacteroidota bacterium]
MLKLGKSVTLIEKSGRLGGLMRAVRWEDYSVDLGQKQFYNRIPEVNTFLHELLGENLRDFPCRIGVFYKGRIYERERKWRGALRGMPPHILAAGMADMAWQRLRYGWKMKNSLQDVAWSQKGRMFSRMFSQGFDEKLKCRSWAEVPAHEAARAATAENGLVNQGHSGQDTWFHPTRGSGGLVDALCDRILDLGGDIRLHTRVNRIFHRNHRIEGLEITSEAGTEILPVRHLAASMRLDFLARLLDIPTPASDARISFKRGVVLVYLYFDAPPAFDHTCLHVTCPGRRVGRITNYAAYNCDMVPAGKACLAFELFCTREDPLFIASDEDLVARVLHEFRHSGLTDFDRLEGHQVFRMPLGDPATSWKDYEDPVRKKMYEEIAQMKNLYNVSRTGMDRTMHAAIH